MEHFEPQNRNEPEVSAGDDRRSVKSLWLELLKTSVLLVAALVVIVIECIAWFASNSRVQSEGISVSAQNQVIRIASEGDRQTAELDFLNLDSGTEYVRDGKTYYYTEGGTIALRLSEDNIAVSPGATGTVTFYVLPNQDGALSAKLYVGLAGYAVKQNNTSAERIDDKTLDALLSGHILLFQSKDENGHYSDWLGMGNTINVTLPDARKGVPYPVTFHWIWPLRYENMKDDYNGLLDDFIESQTQQTALKKIGKTEYYYSQIFLTKEQDLTTTASRSKAYNLADEYIGTKAEYLYLTIQTTAF